MCKRSDFERKSSKIPFFEYTYFMHYFEIASEITNKFVFLSYWNVWASHTCGWNLRRKISIIASFYLFVNDWDTRFVIRNRMTHNQPILFLIGIILMAQKHWLQNITVFTKYKWYLSGKELFLVCSRLCALKIF